MFSIQFLLFHVLLKIIPSFVLIVLSYTGNVNLHKGGNKGSNSKIIIGSSVGAAALLIATIASCILMQKGKKKYSKKGQTLKLFGDNISVFI